MNLENSNIIKNLNMNQFCDFIRYALGAKAFLEASGHIIKRVEIKNQKDDSLNERREKDMLLAYEYMNGKKINEYVINTNDAKNKCFRNTSGKIYDVFTYFDTLGDYHVQVILYGVMQLDFRYLEDMEIKSKDFLNLQNKEKMSMDSRVMQNKENTPVDTGNDKTKEIILRDGRDIFARLQPKKNNFIVGAGVNVDYGIGDWDKLVQDMRSEVAKKIFGSNNQKQCSMVKKVEQEMLNTNYMAPQILKDLDRYTYESTLYNSLYSAFNINTTSKSTNPNIQDTNLFQIARIAANQSKTSRILTFNYDDILEQIIKNNFSATYFSTYYNQTSRGHNPNIEIIHSHGFVPYACSSNGHPYAQGIVLSSYEYMKNYGRSASYARRRLTEQLRNTNIIVGNSMSDYEEQKVFYWHHKKHLSDFSYLFTVCRQEGSGWIEFYKTVYYWKMGVIPVFFRDFHEMNNYLKKL